MTIPSQVLLGGVRILVVAALMTLGMVAVAPFPSARADTQTFQYTGDVQTYTVPAGVSVVQVIAEGGDGGPSAEAGNFVDGVKGARVSTVLEVTPGEELQIRVGGAGDAWVGAGANGGYNGGGSGGDSASGGGGASDVRQGGAELVNRVVVAGGGGGGRAADSPGGVGGTPGGEGGTDVSADVQDNCVVGGGGGATTSAPGAGGVLVEKFDDACNPAFGFADGSAGALGIGADGNTSYAPGGGGGYYGGGSGAGDNYVSDLEPGTGTGAGGGGGSSYVPGDPDALNTTYAVKADESQAAGRVSIAYTLATVVFDGNGGSGSMADQSANVPTALTANAFTRAGYAFTGWNTDAGGTGTAYADQAQYPFSASATLYAQWERVATVPGAPADVVGEAGDGQIVVTWTAPSSDGGSAITSYTAETDNGESCGTGGGESCTILGLTNGRAYRVTVRAANIVGEGPSSSPIEVVPAAADSSPDPVRTADPLPGPGPNPVPTAAASPTAAPAPGADPGSGPVPVVSAPGKVRGLSVKVKKASGVKKKVAIRWKAHSAAETYQIRWTNSRGKKFTDWKSTSKQTFTKKCGRGKYRVQVRAVNGAGAGRSATKRFRVR